LFCVRDCPQQRRASELRPREIPKILQAHKRPKIAVRDIWRDRREMKLLLKSSDRRVKRRELVLTDKFCLSTYLVEISAGTPLTTS
jgi:hypothetical protein